VDLSWCKGVIVTPATAPRIAGVSCKAFSDIKLSFPKFRINVIEKILKHLLIKTCHSIQKSPNKIFFSLNRSSWNLFSLPYNQHHGLCTVGHHTSCQLFQIRQYQHQKRYSKLVRILEPFRVLSKDYTRLTFFNLGANFTKVTTKTKKSQPPTSIKLPSLQERRKTSILVVDQMHLLGLRVLLICMTRTPRFVLFTGIVLGEARPIHSCLGMWTRHMWLV
jgi:hypothetical protein